MCGILAMWRRDGGAIDPALLARATTLMRHRGPDDEGFALWDTRRGVARRYWGPGRPEAVRTTPGPYQPEADILRAEIGSAAGGSPADLALAWRRLAILDLSPAGHQPMVSPDGTTWLIFNGEVYNYTELREELRASHGYTFRSTGDTEVLLRGYEAWGDDVLQHLNGMWGMVLWDAHRQRMLIARDRLGVKPMYWTEFGGAFAVSSEISPLLALRAAAGLAPKPWWPTLRLYLEKVIIDAGDRTFFDGIHRLEPAHVMTVERDSLRIARYWDIPNAPARAFTAADAAARFRELFTDSVRLRLRSDVAVGSSLSGGLDSSSVVACAAPALPHAMHSFSVAYDEGGIYDERRYMKIMGERFGLAEHIDVPDGSDLFEVLPSLVRHQEEPGGGVGLYSQWRVMQAARRGGVTVLLDGQGGDELLAGYTTYLFFYLNDLLASGRVVEWARLLREVSTIHHIDPLHALGRAAQDVIPRGVFGWASRRFGAARDVVMGPALRAASEEAVAPPPARFADRLTQQQFADITHFLPSLLRYEDRNSMAHSIEARLPFLDYRLVEFAFSLPAEAKLRHGETKAVLRDALRDVVPAEILARRDKVGYDTPVDLWFRRRFRGEVEAVLLAPRTRDRGLFDDAALRQRLDQFFAGRPMPHQVWRWVMLEMWCRTFLDGDGAPWAAGTA